MYSKAMAKGCGILILARLMSKWVGLWQVVVFLSKANALLCKFNTDIGNNGMRGRLSDGWMARWINEGLEFR